MGTNFYLVKTCLHCDHESRRHLGKSSSGWTFALRVYPDEGINTWEDVLGLLDNHPEAQILDEYGDALDQGSFIGIVTGRGRSDRPDWTTQGGRYRSEQEFLDRNEAEWGPFNLLRRRLSRDMCIGHGEGTWDYCVGEFS